MKRNKRGQDDLFYITNDTVLMPRSFARTEDPETSHEAARRSRKVGECAMAILRYLRQSADPKSDEQIYFHFVVDGVERYSDTKTRHARLALQEAGLIREAGIGKTQRNRATTLWAATK